MLVARKIFLYKFCDFEWNDEGRGRYLNPFKNLSTHYPTDQMINDVMRNVITKLESGKIKEF